MFNPFGGFQFKPSEEELEVRRKIEETRKKEAGFDETAAKKKTKSDSVKPKTESKNTSEEHKPKENKSTDVSPVKNDSNINTNTNTNTNTADTTGKSKTESSAYYFSKSTDPEKAKQFQPQKLDEQTAKEKEQEKSNTVGSLWNTGSTMEEYDYSEWIYKRLKEELLKIEFGQAQIKITEVEDVGGTATHLFARGKLRAGWDLNFKAIWKGTIDGNEVEGSIFMEDIIDSEDPDDWEFQVGCKKSQNEYEKGRRIIVNEKKRILNAIELVLKEFKSKKFAK